MGIFEAVADADWRETKNRSQQLTGFRKNICVASFADAETLKQIMTFSLTRS
jgi:hypothetical protein